LYLQMSYDHEQWANSKNITTTHYIIFGDAHHVQGDWAKAIWYYQKFESILSEGATLDGPNWPKNGPTDKDKGDRMCIAYGNMGMVYSKIGDMCKAIEYTQKALEIAMKFENRMDQARAYCNLAAHYSKQGDFVQAIKFNEESLKVCTDDDDHNRNKAYPGSLSMERAPERGVKRAQPDTPAPFMERAQLRGGGVNASRDVAGTAQTPASGRAACAVPASAGRLVVEGTTEEMGAGACTQTPGATEQCSNARWRPWNSVSGQLR